MKKVVYSVPSFTLYVEDHEGNNIMHCDCVKWNKQVKNELLNTLKAFADITDKPMFAVQIDGDKKHEKFLKLMEFIFKGTFMGTDNKEHSLYWRNV